MREAAPATRQPLQLCVGLLLLLLELCLPVVGSVVGVLFGCQ